VLIQSANLKTNFKGDTMDNPLACTYKEYYAMAGEFFKATKNSTDYASVKNGHKCLALAYLNLYDQTENENHQAIIILEMATKRLIEAELSIDK